MKIYLIRHGLTKCNKLGTLNGQRIDEPLEPEGLIQAEEAANKIPAGITDIYASPLLRTRQTAEILNKKLGLNIVYCPELMEVDFGDLSGLTHEEVAQKLGKGFADLYLKQVYDLIALGGESGALVKARVKRFLDKILSEPNRVPLIVTHGGIVRAIYHMYYGTEIPASQNAAFHEVEIF
jgi:broad specificity phosphatase PhoE